MTKPSPDKMTTLSQARQTTLASLSKIDEQTLQRLTRLTLPEIHELQHEVARLLPAGNLPAFVLNGLTQLKGRKLNSERVHKDLSTLMRGVELLPESLYGAFFIGPAAILHAYQNLLKLAGKDIQSAFPQGTWQFYLQFGLREDTARHANETNGFQQAIPEPRDKIVAAAAWVSAAIDLIYQYDDLLATDWRERVMLRLVLDEAQQAGLGETPLFTSLVRDWRRALPYHRPPKRPDYLRHRVETFQIFLQDRLQALPDAAQDRVTARYAAERQERLAAYLEQMTILNALTPTTYQEQKTPIQIWRACVGFIWKGRTTLLPICQRNAEGSPLCYLPREDAPPVPLFAHGKTGLCNVQGAALIVDRGGRVRYADTQRPLGHLRPPAPETIRGWIAAICDRKSKHRRSRVDVQLAKSRRKAQSELREKLPRATQTELTLLRRAPILINWDEHPVETPLAVIRQDHRGIGDHALTLFRTQRSTVYDQSHIFFDGVWGMAVAEIMTDDAIHTYHDMSAQSTAALPLPLSALKLESSEAFKSLAEKHRLAGETTAESQGVDMKRLARLRKRLRQRGVGLTINDLLLLYRSLHAGRYERSARVQRVMDEMQYRLTADDYRAVCQAIDATLARYHETNPALLIPMDAGYVAPHERLFPTTYRNPLPEIAPLLATTQQRYATSRDREAWAAFDRERRELLAYLKAFGEYLDALKAVTMRGESFNTATLRLLGHLPPQMQSLLDQIPQHIDALNEVIKGNEVFSNVGRVAPGSSLQRFISAKDDGVTKELVWGILTDHQGQMHISLRDFRPFVAQLVALGETQVATMLTQDYLNSYVAGFNTFVETLSAIISEESPFD
ncbi:MAG: hypothetical protein ACLFTI_02735 [Anaerolineales bacterium]